MHFLTAETFVTAFSRVLCSLLSEMFLNIPWIHLLWALHFYTSFGCPSGKTVNWGTLCVYTCKKPTNRMLKLHRVWWIMKNPKVTQYALKVSVLIIDTTWEKKNMTVIEVQLTVRLSWQILTQLEFQRLLKTGYMYLGMIISFQGADVVLSPWFSGILIFVSLSLASFPPHVDVCDELYQALQ